MKKKFSKKGMKSPGTSTTHGYIPDPVMDDARGRAKRYVDALVKNPKGSIGQVTPGKWTVKGLKK